MSKSIMAMASVAKYFMGFGVVYMFWICKKLKQI
jgi:hypothetical protein